jgi:hypothetical protein
LIGELLKLSVEHGFAHRAGDAALMPNAP